MRKKIFSLVMACCIVFSLFAVCVVGFSANNISPAGNDTSDCENVEKLYEQN